MGVIIRFFFLTVIMFSVGAKAFTASSRPRLSSLARFLSTEAPDTSVVDICIQKIKDALDTTDVKVTGAYDDPNGSHIAVEVVSAKFEGKRAVQRQQLVYKAIWDELQGPVHAVDSMVCKTPDEA
jgi:stress-induced morphogen